MTFSNIVINIYIYIYREREREREREIVYERVETKHMIIMSIKKKRTLKKKKDKLIKEIYSQ